MTIYFFVIIGGIIFYVKQKRADKSSFLSFAAVCGVSGRTRTCIVQFCGLYAGPTGCRDIWSEHKDLNLEPDGYKPPALPLRYVPYWCRPKESNPLEPHR